MGVCDFQFADLITRLHRLLPCWGKQRGQYEGGGQSPSLSESHNLFRSAWGDRGHIFVASLCLQLPRVLCFSYKVKNTQHPLELGAGRVDFCYPVLLKLMILGPFNGVEAWHLISGEKVGEKKLQNPSPGCLWPACLIACQTGTLPWLSSLLNDFQTTVLRTVPSGNYKSNHVFDGKLLCQQKCWKIKSPISSSPRENHC